MDYKTLHQVRIDLSLQFYYAGLRTITTMFIATPAIITNRQLYDPAAINDPNSWGKKGKTK